jgi:protein-S-isoprenylcysteine O-methyltransferase Ste14
MNLPPPLPQVRKFSGSGYKAMSYLLAFVAVGLAFLGVIGMFAEVTVMKDGGSSLRQIVYVLLFGFGTVLFALSLILSAVVARP